MTDVLVCGSREIDDYDIVQNAIEESPWNPEQVIHGSADGVDEMVSLYTKFNQIDEERHPVPNWLWETVGKKAGPMRNEYMVERADVVVAIWDGESPGTKDTIRKAQDSGVPLYLVKCTRESDTWVVVSTETIEGDQRSLGDFD